MESPTSQFRSTPFLHIWLAEPPYCHAKFLSILHLENSEIVVNITLYLSVPTKNAVIFLWLLVLFLRIKQLCLYF